MGNGMESGLVPSAHFVENVQTYVTQLGLDANSAQAFLQERLQQYNLVEMKLLAKQRNMQAKIPDLEKCLDAVATLQAKKGTGETLTADFEVLEGIYSRAHMKETDCVFMAAGLLQKNLDNAKTILEALIVDLLFLRDQITITQVTITRVYNWDLHQRKIQQAGCHDCSKVAHSWGEYGSNFCSPSNTMDCH